MSYNIYWKNQRSEKNYEGCVKNANILTVDLSPTELRLNVIYRQGLQMHCMYCTSFRCTEAGTPEFIPMRTTKKIKPFDFTHGIQNERSQNEKLSSPLTLDSEGNIKDKG